MNRRIRWMLGLVMLLVGAIAFGLAAQPGLRGGPAQWNEPPRLDIVGAAETLGVTEEALIAALGLPEKGPGGPGGQERPTGPRPDLAAVAESLGVTEDALKDALGAPVQGAPDLAAAAAALGITEEALIEALGFPGKGARGGPVQGGPGQGRQQREGPPKIDFAAAAEILGITEAELIAALGLPEGGPQQRGPGGRP